MERIIVAIIAAIISAIFTFYINAAMQELNNRSIKPRDAAVAIGVPALIGFIFPNNLIVMIICAFAVLALQFFVSYESENTSMAWLFMTLLFGLGIAYAILAGWGTNPNPNWTELFWLVIPVATLICIKVRRTMYVVAEIEEEEDNDEK